MPRKQPPVPFQQWWDERNRRIEAENKLAQVIDLINTLIEPTDTINRIERRLDQLENNQINAIS